MKKIILLLIILMSLTSCASNKVVKDDIDDNYRVMYEIFVGSFSDSDGDGIGDLRGIINRLDYLNDGNTNNEESLGIQGIWLSPIFSSPTYHKYDTTDYYEIDSDFGSEEDLKELIEKCHERNVIVILDLVLNHTSNEHPWFKEFVKAHQNNDTENEYYDYYTYCSQSNKIGGHTWNDIYGTNIAYECNFYSGMPELNYDNPKVREKMLEIGKYYLSLGVDGFRFDAAKYIYYGDTKKSAEYLDSYISELKAVKEDLYTVGEVWSSDSEVLAYTSSLNCFNFTLANVEGLLSRTVKEGNVNTFTKYIVNYLNKLKEARSDSMLDIFIANHDMDRSAGYLNTTTKNAYMVANLYLLCSGSPFIYYGEEIGMKGSRGSTNTDANRRLAMLWGDEDTVKDPVGSTFLLSKQINGTVKSQIDNEDSLYNYYRKVIAIRNKYPQIARGEYDYYPYSDNDMGGFIITYNEEITGLFHNTSSVNELSVDVSMYNFKEILDAIGQNDATLKDGILTVGPQTSVILK